MRGRSLAVTRDDMEVDGMSKKRKIFKLRAKVVLCLIIALLQYT